MHQDQSMNDVGTLYVVATPIGNLRDITLRALDVLKTADLVAAEDTRNTAHLLGHFGISVKQVALHEHNERVAAPRIIAALQEGKTVALVSDAGTPGISDPGAILVQAVRAAGLPVVPLPGPNAAICALSAAGREEARFLFYGFLSSKAGTRRKELESLRELPYTIAFYEAPHRIVETVEDILKIFGSERDIIFARELTKLYENIHACKLADAPAWLQGDPTASAANSCCWYRVRQLPRRKASAPRRSACCSCCLPNCLSNRQSS